MIPHFTLMFGVAILSRLADNRRFAQNLVIFIWVLSIAALGLFAGLRSDSVGADTYGYVRRFELLAGWDVIWDSTGSAEIGYKVLLATARSLSNDPTVLLLLTSGVCAVLYGVSIFRISVFPALSLFCFVGFGFYAFHMNALRQGLALGAFMLAIPSLLAGRPIRYVLIVILGACFHISVLFTLPMYPLFRRGFSIWTFALLVAVSVFLVGNTELVFQFAGMANDRYALYENRSETGGVTLTLFHVAMCGLFIFMRRYITHAWRSNYDIFLIMLLLGTMIYVFVAVSGSYVELTRLAIYFTVALVFLWPMLLQSIQVPEQRLNASVLFLLACALYYYIYLSKIGGFIPYELRM